MSTSTSPTNRKVTPRSQRPQEHRRSLFGNHDSLHRDNQDSPTRKILLDFHRLLLEQDLSLQNELNEQLAKQANLHTAALAEASAEHERVRRNAEIARERVELEIEREKTRRENEEKSRLRQEQEAKTRREEEDRQRQRLELERREREQSRRATEERELAEKRAQLEARSRQEAEEAERRKQEALDVAKQKARDAAAGAAKKREETQKAPPAPADVETPPARRKPAAVTQPATTAAVAADPLQQEFEEQHKQYLHIHKRLKEMREYVIMESKKIPALKTRLGDWRREIRKCMGQLTADKTKNRKPMLQIQGVLNESLKYNTPAVDISPYLLSVPHPAPGQPVPYPGVALYLLSIFAKATITQFISETSGGAKSADPVGVVAVTIFATPAFKLNSTIPLIDILLAKYHVVCPALFCVSGPQTTVPGRTRLGWWRDGDTFIPEQRHLERMAGLATGWAALTLRDFSKSKNENPMPNWHYWRAIAGLTNTPTADFGSTHVTIIKGLVEGFVPRFVGFYGAAAKAVLREALVGLPRRLRADGKGQAAAGLEVLREVLQRDLKLTLT